MKLLSDYKSSLNLKNCEKICTVQFITATLVGNNVIFEIFLAELVNFLTLLWKRT